jgi:hypothetical protein
LSPGPARTDPRGDFECSDLNPLTREETTAPAAAFPPGTSDAAFGLSRRSSTRGGEKKREGERKGGRGRQKQNHSTQDSHVVPHHGTNWAALRLTAQIGRDAVLSESYGRGWWWASPRPKSPSARSRRREGPCTKQNSASVKRKKKERVWGPPPQTSTEGTFGLALHKPPPLRGRAPASSGGSPPSPPLDGFAGAETRGIAVSATWGSGPLSRRAGVETAN